MRNNQFCPMSVCCVVSNIPASFHSADLRSFFSHFTESKSFHCFHYKHRPEIRQKVSFTSENSTDDTTAQERGDVLCGEQTKSCCCVIKVDESQTKELLRVYDGKHWVDRKGTYLRNKVKISRLRLIDDANTDDDVSASGGDVTLKSSDCERLPELNPPANLMPQGNVGTPTSYFLALIQACRFPPKLIGHLGLVFSKSKRRKYGAVPLDYSKLDAQVGGHCEDEDKGDGSDALDTHFSDSQSSPLDLLNCRTAHGHLIRDDVVDFKLQGEKSVDENDMKV